MKKTYKLQSEPINEPIRIEIVLAKVKYSTPKLYAPKVLKNGKKVHAIVPGKRWYVYFYWLNPETNRKDIKIMIYKGLNRLDSLQERKSAASALIDAVKLALYQNWVPKQVRGLEYKNEKTYSVGEALDYAYKLKVNSISEATAQDYSTRKEFFKSYLIQNGQQYIDIRQYGLNDFYRFLDWLQLEYKKPNGTTLSNTSIDNYKRSISALFTVLLHKRIIDHNFINDIPKLKSKPVKNKPFTKNEFTKVLKQIKKDDPYLINVIGLMVFALLRPREIIRLKVGDINTENWILGVERKNQSIGYSRVIEKLKPLLKEMNLDQEPKDHHLITKFDKPAVWETNKLSSKVNYFSRRFRKILKKLKFDPTYNLYSVRHTAILDLYSSLLNRGFNEQEIIFKLMPITGHKSQAGLKNYLRDIQAFIPADHSEIYTLEL